MEAFRMGRFKYRYKQINFAYHRFIRNFQKLVCPACGSWEYLFVTEQKPYWVEKCVNCGLGRTLPIRSVSSQENEHDKLYSKDFYIDTYLAEKAPFKQNSYQRGLDHLSQYTQPGTRLLDVGCGFGYFLNMAQQAGYAVEGVELSVNLAQKGKDRFNVTIHPASILAARLDQAYDILTAWDMLEHVVEIDEILTRFRECLKPRGLLLLRVPDFGFIQKELPDNFLKNYLTRLYPLSINQHYYHFSKKNLEIFLARAGFDILEWWPSQDDEVSRSETSDNAQLLDEMRRYDIACEINLIARRIEPKPIVS